MVVEPRDDLGIVTVLEWVVREIGLPGLVWLFGFETDVRRLGSFFGSGVIRSLRARQRWIVILNGMQLSLHEGMEIK